MKLWRFRLSAPDPVSVFSIDDTSPDSPQPDVLRMHEVHWHDIQALFSSEGLTLFRVPADTEIPGSHWGDDEAGLIKRKLYARDDTPVHSAVHEGCHYLMMNDQRRSVLHTDAGGTATEENAVCYLQILLADKIRGMGRDRMMSDMDLWGYSFRLGSTRAWYKADAEDAIAFLKNLGYSSLLN